MAEPVTVRFYPLGYEHVLPMLVDVGCLVLLMAATVTFGPWWPVVVVIVVVATSQPGRDPYRLRLVLTGNEPPAGRFLTGTELKPYAKGPVVMTLHRITTGPGDSRADRCQERVYAELERHGVTRPDPYALRFHSVKYTREEEALAMGADLMRGRDGTRPVTVNHPAPRDAEQAHLVDTVLPELATAHGSDTHDKRTDGYSIFFFAGPGAEQSSTEFIAAAQAIVPARWHITQTALPEPLRP